MLDASLSSRLEKLDHKKTIFAGLHRGGSSVFNDIVLHILKLKSITDKNPSKLPTSLRPTKKDTFRRHFYHRKVLESSVA